MAFWHLFDTKQKGCQRFGMRLSSECCQLAQTIQLRQGFRSWAASPRCVSTSGSGCTDGQHRSRPTSTQVDVESCLAPLLRLVLCLWQSDRLALAVDPTMKGDQFNSIVISVACRSCAVQVAWQVLEANRPGEWIAPTLRLLDLLSEAAPEHMSVVVMCDRGLTSPRLWKKTCSVGRHPCIRQSINTMFCPDGGTHLPARTLVPGPGPGRANVGYGTAFRDTSKRRLGTEQRQSFWPLLPHRKMLPNV